MRGVLGQVHVEDDVDAAGHAHLAAHRQPGVLGDLGAAAVGADEVLGADGVLVAAQPVLDGDRDALVVLDEGLVDRAEAQLGAACDGRVDEHGLHEVLRHVAHTGGTGQFVRGLDERIVAPGADPAQLLPARLVQKVVSPISRCGVACATTSASTPRSRSTSMVRWLVMCARGVSARRA